MLENVPGLLRNQRLRVFKRGLRGLGYVVKARIMNVVDFEVPQRRRRMVLLGSRVSGVNFAAPVEGHKTVRDAIGGLRKPGKTGDPVHDLPETRSEEVRARIRAVPPNGGSRRALPKKMRLKCHEHQDGFKDVYGRMSWVQPAPTITTGCFNPSKGRFLHPTQHRGISLREAALLQGFPGTYYFPAGLGRLRLATMIGNALPPKFVEHQARSLRQTLEAEA